MFPTLRLKLTVAFLTVTVLTVLLSAAGMMLLLRDREIAAARDRIGQLGNAVAEQVTVRAGAGWRADTLGAFLQQRADELHVRFLLVDAQGVVITDTDGGKLHGQRADDFTANSQKMRHSALAGFGFTSWQNQVVIYPNVGPVIRPLAQEYRVLMLVPEADIARAWQGLVPRVAISGGAALAVALAVAWMLSRSISRPVVEVTHASEEMARGHYDQQIPVEGRDEIARLARVFNDMAHRVARSHQAMRDLNGNVAHELKTPLTSIQGYSQALLDGIVQSPEETEHAARVINDEAERMRRLVDDLLYLSRLESGTLQIERAPVSVGRLLETTAERFRWRMQENGRELSVRMGIDVPPVLGDARRLEQVLANLLSNAERHTPAGGRITVTAEWSLGHVTLTVHNTGSYIAPEHLARIFERFYQVDPARTRDGHHGGLGLAIVREIVLAHGGGITASSDPATGTTFRLTLPTALGAATPPPPDRAPAVASLAS